MSGQGGMGGWEITAGRARRALRGLLADAMAVLALAIVLALFWWFGGVS